MFTAPRRHVPAGRSRCSPAWAITRETIELRASWCALQRPRPRPFTLFDSGRRRFRTTCSERQSKHCEYHGLEALKGPSLHGPSPCLLLNQGSRSGIAVEEAAYNASARARDRSRTSLKTESAVARDGGGTKRQSARRSSAVPSLGQRYGIQSGIPSNPQQSGKDPSGSPLPKAVTALRATTAIMSVTSAQRVAGRG